MNTMIRLAAFAVLASGLMSQVVPASATNTREALAACLGKPNCGASVGPDGVVITVNPGTNGTVIVCPIKNGPCGVMKRTHSSSRHEGGNSRGNVSDGQGGGQPGGSAGGAPGGPSFN